MIARSSGFGIGVVRFSGPLRGVGVLAMPDARLDTTRRDESICMVPLRPGVLRLLVPGVAVGVIVERRCVADGLEVPG
jgi:hypothetical protein